MFLSILLFHFTELETDQQQRHRSHVARIRWHLTYTLIKNPDLQELRKHKKKTEEEMEGKEEEEMKTSIVQKLLLKFKHKSAAGNELSMNTELQEGSEAISREGSVRKTENSSLLSADPNGESRDTNSQSRDSSEESHDLNNTSHDSSQRSCDSEKSSSDTGLGKESTLREQNNEQEQRSGTCIVELTNTISTKGKQSDITSTSF